jgi:hypothetical protein
MAAAGRPIRCRGRSCPALELAALAHDFTAQPLAALAQINLVNLRQGGAVSPAVPTCRDQPARRRQE